MLLLLLWISMHNICQKRREKSHLQHVGGQVGRRAGWQECRRAGGQEGRLAGCKITGWQNSRGRLENMGITRMDKIRVLIFMALFHCSSCAMIFIAFFRNRNVFEYLTFVLLERAMKFIAFLQGKLIFILTF